MWVSNATDGTISVINSLTNTVSETIPVGGAPRGIVFTADDSIAYLLNAGLGQVQIINTIDNSITAIGSGYSGLNQAILSADESELYTIWSGGDRVIAIDTTTGLFDLGARPNLGGVTRDAAQSPDGAQLWVAVDGSPAASSVQILDSTGTTIIDTIPLPASPAELSFTESGDYLFVTIPSRDTAVMIDVAAREVLGEIIVGEHPTGILDAPDDRMIISNRDSDTLSLIGFEQDRLAGPDRFATAVAVSQASYPSGASVVFVASGLDFPDALSAGPAAANLGGPLLLTNRNTLPSAVAAEITRLNPGTIYVVGGPSVVSTAVENALIAIEPNTFRLAGSNRYATGDAVVTKAWDGETIAEVFIATGRNFPDALSAGAVAAARGIPVILVDGARTSVPQTTIDLIRNLGATEVTIAGGPSVVSAEIETQLGVEFSSVRRLAGADRYATSAVISLDAYPTNTGVIYATGTGFADALAGTTLAGRAEFPVYLVKPGCVPQAALDALYSGATSNLYLLGGTGALSSAVAQLTPCP